MKIKIKKGNFKESINKAITKIDILFKINI